MIDLNKPASPEQEIPADKNEVEILKAKLRKLKRKLRCKDKYIHNLKGSYSEKISALKAEIKFDNIMLITFAILLAIATFKNDSDHKNGQVSDSHEFIQIQKSEPKEKNDTGDKVVSSNSQNLLQVADEKNAYPTADDIKDDIIFKTLELEKDNHSAEQLYKNFNPYTSNIRTVEGINYIARLFHEDSLD